nr:unnamed protein product [Callosobruchus analis]
MELAEGQLKCMGSEQSQVNKLFQKPSRQQSYGQARQASRKQMYGQSGQSSNQSFKHQNSQVPNQPMKKCKRCLKVHWDDNKCPAVNWRCFSCNQTGHTARSVLCKNRVHNVLDEDQQDSEEDTLELGWLSLNYVSKEKSLQVKVIVEGKLLKMEVDSGACKSVMHIDDYNELFPDIELTPVSFKLKVVTGQNVTIIGQADVTVQYEKQICKLPLIILDSIDRFTPLLGRNWLNVINPSWRSVLVESKSSDNDQIKSNVSSKGHESIAPGICEEICAVTSTFTHTVSKIRDLILEVKSEFASNFQSNSKNRIKKFKADVKVKEDVKPIFHRAYEMPYSLKPKVEEELSKMVESGILTKVSHSDWASPIVVVPKRNSNDIRICVDFKKSVNKVIDSEHCVLPLPDDIFASLSGSKFFTVLDLKGAFQQLEISDSSKELFTINTHMGLFRYNTLTYGISSAPGIFQSVMETILSGMSNVKCYLDDILIHGSSLSECHLNVKAVMQRLKNYNVKINERKCVFYQNSIEFLGHKIDEFGIHPTNYKIECIEKAPTPENLTQLKSYLGLLNYYGKFIPMLSSKLKPLYDLCKSGVEFIWTDECENTFQMSKKLITSEGVLTHFSPSLPIYVSCDASGYGVGAVLSHHINGEEKPVLFASSTLSAAEKLYSNLERESLAIIFALKKFHKYIFGRKFVLLSDHQPLQYIFGRNKGIPVTAASRITRWAITLSAYDYDIQYKKGKLLANADGLSRLPMSSETQIPSSLYSFNLIENIPLHSNDISKATIKDLTLVKVIDHTKSGWPSTVQNEKLKPFFLRRNELSVESNCLLLGNRVIIPEALQNEVLELFHEQHLGIVRTKMLIRAYCWWPNINNDIEKFISLCEVCQTFQNFSNNTTLSWPAPTNNFFRLHIDFFHKDDYAFLILVDDKSKWLDVKLMQNGTNAKNTILKLKETFAIFGLPVELVSDNGPLFNSQEFIAFCQANGIKPIKSPPYHPQSNGLAERNVQTVKKSLEKALFFDKKGGISTYILKTRLYNFLFTHRCTPSTVTGISPSENILKVKPRTRFDLLKSCSNKAWLDSNSDNFRKTKLYTLNQPVYVKNKQLKVWQKARVVKVLSFSTYLVQVNNVIRHVHSSDIRTCLDSVSVSDDHNVQVPLPHREFNSSSSVPSNNSPLAVPDINFRSDRSMNMEVPEIENPNIKSSNSNQQCQPTNTVEPGSGTPKFTSTRSGRMVKPPRRLDL